MRRQINLLLLLFLGTVAVVSAQSEPGRPGDGIPLDSGPEQLIAGAWQPVELEQVAGPLATEDLTASDICKSATQLTLPQGGSTVVNTMTTSPNAAINDFDPDPTLSCMWGSPSSKIGYRTVWYRFTPSSSGQVRISTFGSNYDTVLAVHTGACGNLSQLHCSDDANFLSSEVTFLAISGQTYFIEVADWESPAPEPKTLQLAALIEPVTAWQFVGTLDQGISRHAAALVPSGTAPGIYLLGGQLAEASGIPTLTNQVIRYQTDKAGVPGQNPVEVRAPMCHRVGQSCEPVYRSNTAAAYVSGTIYSPSGFDGNLSSYDGRHLAYNVATNSWVEVPDNSWAGEPPIYISAVPYGAGLTARYLVAGGLTGPLPFEDGVSNDDWQARAEVYSYYPSVKRWIDETNLSTGRFGHSTAVINLNGYDHLCVVGGIGKGAGGPQLLSGTECHNLEVGGDPIFLGSLNRPRYWAASAVDPDGNWYVFGGHGSGDDPVDSTERFDPATGQWELLDARYDLGSTLPFAASPPRAWPRGAFLGQTLWSFGGEIYAGPGALALSQVEKIDMPRHRNIVLTKRTMLPLVNRSEKVTANNVFARATLLPLNQVKQARFEDVFDIADVYYYAPSASRQVTVRLTEVPVGSIYRLHIYNSAKQKIVQSATNEPGTQVSLNASLAVGQKYYIVVEREYPFPGEPSGQFYKIIIQG